MRYARKRRAAFTLTEMLMAAGILGIGLTMVASIFPVAVDQSRRSSDQTHAALCARSVASVLRFNRADFIKTLRTQTQSQFIEVTGSFLIPDRLRIYKPSVFLYNTEDRTYDGVRAWDAGNYVARVWIYADASKPERPWRTVILVCKSTGESPQDVNETTWNVDRVYRKRVKPGAYFLNTGTYAGYAYMLDYIEYPPSQSPIGYLAVGKLATVDSNTIPGYSYYFLDAIAAYSTIVGD